MKNRPLLFVAIAMSLTILLLATNCRNSTTESNSSNENRSASLVPSAQLLQLFNQEPPIAKQLFIQKLSTPDAKGNTILLLAKFEDTDPRIKELSGLNINLLPNKIINFNDEGRDGDEKARDGQFTVPLKFDDDEIKALFERSNSTINVKKRREVQFVGRSAVFKDLAALDFESFKLGKVIPLPPTFTSIIDASNIVAIRDKSLMITDTSVVEDKTRTYDPCRSPKGNPNGVWSFGHLITNMANQPLTGVTPKDFLTNWVDRFLFAAHVHPGSGDATTDRIAAKTRLVKAWMRNSGIAPPPGALPANWATMPLKIEEFPVRLLAIVNRLDLRGNAGYGAISNAGEGRLVFCFVDSNNNCSNGNNGRGTMTFIFEYGIPINDCTALNKYATNWWNLRNVPFGATFNSKLEAITKVFTKANANAGKPNKSALNHLRTDEFIMNPWVIRDFEIDGTSKRLKIIHPSKEPMDDANGFTPSVTLPNPVKQVALVTFVNSLPFATNPNPRYSIPNALAGMHAPMNVPPSVRYHWRGTANSPMDSLNRREFSLNTCSGCHKGETFNTFTHVRPRSINSRALISGFMSGLGADDNSADIDTDPMGFFFVNDPGPASGLSPKQFNEALRRAQDLEKLVFNSPCLPIVKFPQDIVAINEVLTFRPLNMTH